MTFLAFLTLIEQYGPTVVSLLMTYGPEVWSDLAPLVEKSVAAGTLTQDIAAIESVIAQMGGLSGLLGRFESLAALATALGSINQIDLGNPAPDQDRLARTNTRGR